MPTYTGSGTEPLGGKPTVKHESVGDSPGGGKSVGGKSNLGANLTIKEGSPWRTTGDGYGETPSTKFNDHRV